MQQNIPDWVKWLAQDADGTWWGYEVEPLQHDNGWYENEVGRNYRIGWKEATKDWELTLQQYKRTPPHLLASFETDKS